MLTSEKFCQTKCVEVNHHFICRSYLKYGNKINCAICGEQTERNNLEYEKHSKVKETIKSFLSELFDDLNKRVTEELIMFKDLLEEREIALDVYLKYFEEEIEIRIESIKNNLDELFETFKNDLVKIKEEITEIKKDALKGTSDIAEFEFNLNELREYIQNNELKTEKKFYEHQDNFKNINKMINKFKDALQFCEFDFKPSKDQVKKELIGEMVFGGLQKYKIYKINQVFRRSELETQIEKNLLSSKVNSCNIMPNGNVLCGGSNSLIELDVNLQIIKNIPFNRKIHCTLNHRNEIYVSVGHKIILFDLNFKELKQFGIRSRGNDGFFAPSHLRCDDEYLYVCDSLNHRVQILTFDLSYVDTIIINDIIYRMEISETTIYLVTQYTIQLFDLKTRIRKEIYDITHECSSQLYYKEEFYDALMKTFFKK